MSRSRAPAAPRFTILLVCEANICRSPMAEMAIRHLVSQLPGASAVRVSSAGLTATAGRPMHPESAAILASTGIDASGFASRRLANQDLESDLILVADRSLRAAVAMRRPAAVRRVLTIRQAARLLAAVPEPLRGRTALERVAGLLPAMHLRRGTTGLVPAIEDDIVDPFGQSAGQFRLAWAQLHPLVEELARVLGCAAPSVDANAPGGQIGT
jgi:protein-tyrosine phosphatase